MVLGRSVRACCVDFCCCGFGAGFDRDVGFRAVVLCDDLLRRPILSREVILELREVCWRCWQRARVSGGRFRLVMRVVVDVR